MRISFYKVLTMISMVAVLGILTTGCGEKKAEESAAAVADSIGPPPPPPPPADTTYITSPATGQAGFVTLTQADSTKVDLTKYTVTFIAAPGTVTNGTWNPQMNASVTVISPIGQQSRISAPLPTNGVADQPISVIVSTGETRRR